MRLIHARPPKINDSAQRQTRCCVALCCGGFHRDIKPRPLVAVFRRRWRLYEIFATMKSYTQQDVSGVPTSVGHEPSQNAQGAGNAGAAAAAVAGCVVGRSASSIVASANSFTNGIGSSLSI